jgi:hypothetical protein
MGVVKRLAGVVILAAGAPVNAWRSSTPIERIAGVDSNEARAVGGLENLGYVKGAAAEMVAISADGSVAAGSSNSGTLPVPEIAPRRIPRATRRGFVAVIPEPGHATTLLSGALALVFLHRRRDHLQITI